jgi:capsular exopolysaccharide synthesis family protein
MSQMYEALRQMEKEQEQKLGRTASPRPPELLHETIAKKPEFTGSSTQLTIRPAPGVIALTEPKSSGAEKFRSLAARIDFIRRQNKMRSFQVTSSMNGEGKTFVATNVAITLSKYSSARVLLVEGDLHRPTIADLLGQRDLKGITQWWSGRDQDLDRLLYRLDEMPLWLLGAGAVAEQPSEILQSTRFVEAFKRLADCFDWIVVDSTPMLPIIDATLWSRLLDGTLLVIREGVASVQALKRGIESFDSLKLIGTVMNGTSKSDLAAYGNKYYSAGKKA